MASSNKRKRHSKGKSESPNRRRRKALVSACERLLSASVKKVEYPGGRSRESCRLVLSDGRTVIATRRSTPQRADIEARILRALNKHRVPVPKLLDTDGHRIIFQEEIIGQRLSLQLKDTDGSQLEKLLDSAVNSLLSAQLAGAEEKVETDLPSLGVNGSWIKDLLKRPVVLGQFFEVPPPTYDVDKLRKLLKVTKPRFVKWDSRPGNALVDAAGTVYWYDWEHAGARNRLDDLAWLLCDEFVPDHPGVEATLLERYIPRFADSREINEAREYLMAYGTFHTLVRLGLVLKNKKDGEWWDKDYCIDRDKVGITLDCAQRLCARGSRWAGGAKATESLAPWFQTVSERIAMI